MVSKLFLSNDKCQYRSFYLLINLLTKYEGALTKYFNIAFMFMYTCLGLFKVIYKYIIIKYKTTWVKYKELFFFCYLREL